MICAICGKFIDKNISKDHVYPRSIWKWQEQYLTNEEFKILKRAVESADNIVKVHPECNFGKEDHLVEIEELVLDAKRYNKLCGVREKVKPYIESYYGIKSGILEGQNGLCAKCGKPTDINGVLRRINKKDLRTKENGCIICSKCNENNRWERLGE